MPEALPYCLYREGESFLPEARRLVRDHGGGCVELIQVDLGAYEWRGGPIKILLVDAMKSEAVARHIANSFFPSLQVGSLLIHQDFKHYYTSWIHVIHYRLREHFRFFWNVLGSGTVAFELVRPITSETVSQATDLRGISDVEIDSAFRYSIDIAGSQDGTNVAAAHVMHYIHLGRKERASKLLASYSLAGWRQGSFH